VSPPVADSDALQPEPARPRLWICSLRLAKPTWVGPDRADSIRPSGSVVVAIAAVAGGAKSADRQFRTCGAGLNATGSALITWASGAHVVYGLNFDNTQIAAVVRLLPRIRPRRRDTGSWNCFPRASSSAGESCRLQQSDIVADAYEQPPPDSGIHGEADIVNAAITEIVPGVRLSPICRRICG